MLKIYPFEELGHADHGWLNARHHFSFSRYQNPDRINFGSLRVINDDTIQPHKGFATHPHENMEIITYVRSGAISHKDNKGNEGKTKAGDIQVMSAGTGITHSEHNHEDEVTTLYQIWIIPDEMGVKPRWDAKEFPKESNNNALPLLVSGDKNDKNALFIHSEAQIYGGNVDKGITLDHSIKHQIYILVSKGKIEIDGQEINKGDGAEITEQSSVKIKTLENSEILIIDVPNKEI